MALQAMGRAQQGATHHALTLAGTRTSLPPAFWQLCMGTNKVYLFSELHPVCVSAYPRPWGGPGRGPGEASGGRSLRTPRS